MGGLKPKRPRSNRHYLLAAIALITSGQFIGNPIHCSSDSVSDAVMTSYWIAALHLLLVLDLWGCGLGQPLPKG